MNNGRRHAEETKQKARELRARGRTHREIAKELSISLGSAHLWTEDILITDEQKKAIEARKTALVFTKERLQRQRELALINLVPQLVKYTKDDLIKKIVDFYKEHGRIPLKREFNMYGEYQRRFGSWNNAVKLAGFDVNPVLFAKKFIATDGHKCDSFSEKIIDDWFYEKRIIHERHVPYGDTRMTADFAVGNIRIEFFGLAGEQKAYDDFIQRKREYCNQQDLQLIEIYPDELYEQKDFLDMVVYPKIILFSKLH